VEAGIQDRRGVLCLSFHPGERRVRVFASLDLFMLFFFYEIAVPMYLLIVIWAGS